MHKLTDPQGRSLYLSDREHLAVAARLLTPQEMPASEYRPGLSAKLLRLVGLLVLIVVVLSVATTFFILFGQERAEQVRPELTAQQRASAFRHHGN